MNPPGTKTPQDFFELWKRQDNGISFGFGPAQVAQGTDALKVLVNGLSQKRLMAEEGLISTEEAEDSIPGPITAPAEDAA